MCDETDGQKCEFVPDWIDDEGNIHHEPFELMEGNHFAMIMYDKIVALSPLQEVHYSKGQTRYSGRLPTLQALPFVLNEFCEHLDAMERSILVEKIQTIHNIRINSILR